MKIGGEYTFDGPQDLVWEMLLDPTVLAQVLPGAERLERTGENEFEGRLRMKVGPIQGDFQGKVRLEDLDPPSGYTMHVDGRGAPGFVKATGHLALSAAADGRTALRYDGDAQVGGKLAAVGQRLIESSTRASIAQSLEGLNAAVQARVLAQQAQDGPTAAAPSAGQAEPPAFETPTQAQFAAGVARQVAQDLVPPMVRRLVFTGITIGVLILLWLLLR